MSHLIALLACHNRREQTVACLRSLFDQQVQGLSIDAIVVDDGSADGTAEAAQQVSNDVFIVRGDGSLFWARAMAIAEEHAVRRDPDFLLWLNDDVVLHGDALETLLACQETATDGRIVVGSTIDPVTRSPTYGGVRIVGWYPLRCKLVAPADGASQAVDTLNGNIVLVPRTVYLEVGGIDGAFSHAQADFDYGLRASAVGFEVVVSGLPVGTCAHHPGDGSWRDVTLPAKERLRLAWGRKGIPPISTARFFRRHGGRYWFVFWAATYVKLAVSLCVGTWTRRGAGERDRSNRASRIASRDDTVGN